MTKVFDIKNKTALITGANRGIGKVIADSFLEHGAAKIYAAVRNPESAASLVDEYGDRVKVIEIDMSKPTSITEAAQKAQDVDVVVNNAGVLTSTTPMQDNALESLNYEMDINVGGLVRMAQAFAPVLKTNGGGAFIQLNSIASLKSFVSFTTYSASKAAAYSITQALREVLSEQGTHVISVHPGPIATDMGREAGLHEIAEPATLVADSIITALNNGEFHAFPDTIAKQFGGEYQNFATNIVEANIMEA